MLLRGSVHVRKWWCGEGGLSNYFYLWEWDKYVILQQLPWLTTRWHNPTQHEALRPQTPSTSWWVRSSWTRGGEERLYSFKRFAFRKEKGGGVGGWSQEKKYLPWKEINNTLSRCLGRHKSFFSPRCGRDEIAWWPITWVANRTPPWNSDYYLQRGTCSSEPFNPRACG